MNEITIYMTVVLITTIICLFYAIFVFTKMIVDQHQTERDLIDKIEEVKKLCGY
mgnify:FL=1